jgi:hypothetical protein
MDKTSWAQDKKVNQNVMAKLPKSFLYFLNFFKTFMVQCDEAMVQHDEATRILGQITNGSGVVGSALSKVSTKVVIKARIYELLHREKDEDKDSAVVATPSKGVFGNPTP